MIEFKNYINYTKQKYFDSLINYNIYFVILLMLTHGVYLNSINAILGSYASYISMIFMIMLSFFEFKTYSIKIAITVIIVFVYFSFMDMLYSQIYFFIGFLHITCFFVFLILRLFKFAVYYLIIWAIWIFSNIYFNHFGFDYSSTVNVTNFNVWLFIIMLIIFSSITLMCIFLLSNVNLFVKSIESKNTEIDKKNAIQLRLESLKEVFFANISHEIRTPLNAIKGISDLLCMKEDSSENDKKLFDLMNYSTSYLLSLVNNFLDFTKLNEGKILLVNSEFNLEKCIEYIYQMNKKQADEKQLNFSLTKQNNIPEIVCADKSRLSQIIINIINNAIKYTDNGKVSVYFGGKIDKLDLSIFNFKMYVFDTGIGIEEDNIDVIFEKYFRLDNGLNESVGLGLTITYELLHLMNGKIKVVSKKGKGTCFIINIPLNIKSTQCEIVESISNDYSVLNDKKILVVDDNKLNQLVIKKQLNKILVNAEVHLANNGAEGLDSIINYDYDIVLLDLRMPVMDGVEMTKRVRVLKNKDKMNVPIIAVTASLLNNNKESCISVGMNDYINKPFDIDVLLNKMVNLVR